MLIRHRPRWALPASAATPEAVWLDRRRLMAGLGAIAASGVVTACAAEEEVADPSAGLYPLPRNEAYTIERPVTPEEVNSRYNNYYEFGSGKDIWRLAQRLPLRPWEVAVDGLVETPFTIGIDDLLARMPLEERLYRHRCVEAWSMTIPWGGFPMRAFVEMCKPLGSAKYVRMETFMDRKVAPGQRTPWYDWPYVEGLTIAEATNELAFLVTGTYGKPAAPQFGAPLRLAVPWKYGFKSIKAIVRFTFTEERPKTFWEKSGPTEYGFWANVNPDVPHPRWSQASERVLGTDERIPTRLFNGYAEEVAGLYAGMEGERLFM
ncbi:MAG: protein-methionine-sulfoxide reductase catalytic subunit MsrP [Alphaproteobacteria bacterium]|nr:protein-methionine-sulfoxide reductase catalytic subunit MsrP [Alphaproteobacteria bacterium]